MHIDIVGPLPSAHRFTYMLKIDDRFSRWPDAFPIRNTSVENIANVVTGSVNFIVSSVISTEKGTQFQFIIFV